MVESGGWEISAYCGCMNCCGKTDCVSANGTKLTNAMAGKVCAAPKDIPFGTQIKVSGAFNGTLTVVDRGGAIVGKKLDVWMGTSH